MHTAVDDTLLEDAERYQLRFRCEHCAHFDVETAGCAEGYPNAVHRHRGLSTTRTVVFCKSFELA